MMRYFIILLMFANLMAAGEERFPSFVGENFQGEPVRFSDSTGAKAIIVSFWASWCKPCLKELKKLEEFYKIYADSGLAVFAVNEDAARAKQNAESIVKANRFSFEIVHDKDGQIKRAVGVSQLPTIFLLDGKLRIIYRRVGYKKGDEIILFEKVKEIIRKGTLE